MAILKYKMTDGWKILYKDFFQKVVSVCKQALQRGKNLSDLENVAEARANLGLDQIYIRRDDPSVNGPFSFANNTWNKVGDDALFGDKNKTGKFAIKGQNGETGIALVANNSPDDSNYGCIDYDGTSITTTKPFYSPKGFTCKLVNEADLNGFHYNGFFKGGASVNLNILPDVMKNKNTGKANDYAGLAIGDWEDGQGTNPRLAQLVFDGTRIFTREWDVESEWSSWKEVAFKSDIPTDNSAEIQAALTNYTKKDASNITDVAKWAAKLGAGNVASGNTGLITGGKVYTAIEAAKTALNANIETAKSTLNSSLTDYAKKDASNLTVADKTKWITALGTGSVAKNNTGLVTGGKVYTAISDAKSELNASISSLTTKINDVASKATKISHKNYTDGGCLNIGDGLILQWGKQFFSSGIVVSVNFNQPFSTVYSVVANGQRVGGSMGGTYTYHMLYENPTKTGFVIKSNIEGGSGGQYIHWIAIGKPLDPSEILTTVKVTIKTVNSGHNPWIKVAYTDKYGDLVTTSRLTQVGTTTLNVAKNTTIKIIADSDPDAVSIYQGSTLKKELHYKDTWTSGKITADTTFTCKGHAYNDGNYDDSGCCVAEGTMVTCFVDNKYVTKKIEDIQSGDVVVGANGQLNEVYARTDTVLGAARTMYTFTDQSLFFTGEHSMWVRYKNREYFGIHDISGYYRETLAMVGDKSLLEWEQEEAYRKNSVVGKPISKGLSQDPIFVLWEADYGTDKGWKTNRAVIAKDKVYTNNTPVHTLIVGGNHTYFANGYLVSGFATDADYNYNDVKIENLNL